MIKNKDSRGSHVMDELTARAALMHLYLRRSHVMDELIAGHRGAS